MAIEVIIRGEPPIERVFNCTCNKCKSVLRFKQSDGKVTLDQRDGDFITITCPVCAAEVHTNM